MLFLLYIIFFLKQGGGNLDYIKNLNTYIIKYILYFKERGSFQRTFQHSNFKGKDYKGLYSFHGFD